MLKIFRQPALPIGLDIGDISLRLVQFFVSKTGKREVQAYVDKTIPKETIIGDQIKNPRVLVSTIKAAIKNPQFGKFVGNEVVASIPETKSFVRVIEMPQMSETEAKEAIKWEAEQYVPLPIGQVYLDWVALDKYDGGSDGQMKVLLTASPRDYVDDLTRYLKEADLRPVALEVESQATARSLIGRNEKDITSLLLDINAVRSSFIVYEHGNLQFTSSIPIAGHSFTDSITKVLNIPFDKAEQIKRKVGLEKEAESGMVRKALLPVLANLVAEIRNTLKFYEEHEGEKSNIKRLILTGGSSKLKDLPSYLSQKLKASQKTAEHQLRSIAGMKVELGNPWINVLSRGQTPLISRTDSLSFSTAIGLALRELEE